MENNTERPTRPGQAVTTGYLTGITTSHPVKQGNKTVGVWQKINVIWLGASYEVGENVEHLVVITNPEIISK